MFSTFSYVNFEDIEQREFAISDPKGFLNAKGKKLIIDEAQCVTDIFSFIQLYVDSNTDRQYILTGSQNFLLMEQINQSLAGRVALFNLLPFSMSELQKTPFEKQTYQEAILYGGYPRIYDKELNPGEWLRNYNATYVERDVRQIINIGDLNAFQKFMALCAGRIGQLINFSSIANELSIKLQVVLVHNIFPRCRNFAIHAALQTKYLSELSVFDNPVDFFLIL
jgi:predicted AAA+ superfamily ATPase